MSNQNPDSKACIDHSREIMELEGRIMTMQGELRRLQRENRGPEVRDYVFETLAGPVSLSALFGNQERLLVIHNMGQGCRYCTLWADGFNGLLPHMESAMSVVLVSRDPPELQHRFAGSRGWRFRLASHGGGDYIREQTVMDGKNNMPGAVLYERSEGRIYRRNSSVFGPGDLYCAMWSLLGLGGLDDSSWIPQFNYWQRPAQMDDGGKDLEPA